MNNIIRRVKKGSPLQVRRDHYGRVDIKLDYGPLKLFSRRYRVDYATYDEIKNRLRLTDQSQHSRA